jgi:uncharacterized repeat protein (TIGR01451 family)
MKLKLLPLLLLLILNNSITAQTWNQDYFLGFTPTFNVYTAGLAFCFDQTNGGFISMGLSYADDRFYRINSFGDTLWSKSNLLSDTSTGTFLQAEGGCISRLSNGSYAMCSFLSDTVNYSYRKFLFRRIDNSGNILSSILQSRSSNTEEANILPIANGGYYLLRSADSLFSVYINGNLNDTLLIRSLIEKHDSTDALVWCDTFQYSFCTTCNGGYFSSTRLDIPNAHLSYDGGLVYGKLYDTSQNGNIKGVIEKLNPDGSMGWWIDVSNVMNVPGVTTAQSEYLFTTSDSSVVFSGTTFGNNAVGGYYKLNASGVLTDSTFFGASMPIGNGVELSTGNYLFSSQYQSGFTTFDKHLHYLNSFPFPFNEWGQGYAIYTPIPNPYGGGFWPTLIDNDSVPTIEHLFVVNFDSLFNGYPNSVSGNVYLDENNNCQPDPGDLNINNALVKLSNGTTDYYAFSTPSGSYRCSVPAGTYDVTHPVSGNYVVNECPAAGYSYTLNTPTNISDANFYDALIPGIRHLKATLYCEPMVSGYGGWFGASIVNYGTVTANTTFQVIKDPSVAFISSNPAPINISGDTLTYAVVNLAYDSVTSVEIQGGISPSTPVGTPLSYTTNVSFTNNIYLNDTTDTLNTEVVSSFDPNSKTVNRPLLYNARRELTYLVHFQNTGTAPARNIVVIDSIDNHLDVSSIKLLGASPQTPSITWRDGNVIYFRFNNVNLPDSMSNPTGSQGYFTYSINPKFTAQIGDTIYNRAYIYFDYNAPVITDSTVNVLTGQFEDVKNVTPASEEMSVYPNPSSGNITVLLPKTNSGWQLTVTDVKGEMVLSKKYDAVQKVDMNLHAADGVYFIKARNIMSGNTLIKKFVITH